MPGFADRANDKRYQAYREFTPGMADDEAGYRNYATYYSEGASADTGAKINEFEQFYKATGGGGENRVSMPSEAPPEAPAGGGGGAGAPVENAGLAAALSGLRSAAAPAPAQAPMSFNVAGPGGGNPNLGQRTPPISMRKLAAMLPRIY